MPYLRPSPLLLLILSVLLSLLILSCDPDEAKKKPSENNTTKGQESAVPIDSLGTISTTASKDASKTSWVLQGNSITFTAAAKDEDKQDISQEDIAKVEFSWEWRKRGKDWKKLSSKTNTVTIAIDANKHRVGAYELHLSAKSGDNQANNHAKPYKFTVRKQGCLPPSTSTADKPDTVAKLRSRAKRLTGEALQAIDTSLMKNMNELFRYNRSFNGEINCWDVSNVTSMRAMFHDARAFDRPIGDWDVSNVTDMYGLFASDKLFNQNIGNWDVSKVTDMSFMFYETPKFNNGGSASIGKWDTSSVTNMDNMFDKAAAFNQNLRGWKVSKVSKTEHFARGTTAWKDNDHLPNPLWPNS